MLVERGFHPLLNGALCGKPIKHCAAPRPNLFSFAEPSFESSEDDSVSGLGLPVGLRVLDRGEMLFGSQFGDEVLESVVDELGVVVGD